MPDKARNSKSRVKGDYLGKRIFDFIAALIGLTLLSPILILLLILIWSQDFKNPFYFGPRIGKNGKHFHMVKMRSMTVDADKSGVSSTSASDARITRIGMFVRRFKIDELTQLWNVLVGEMSLVGPRPQIKSDVDHYTEDERDLLLARPGITDLSSIVFSDEGEILAGSTNPDLDYTKLIRPWKIRLGLVYVRNCNFVMDFRLCLATIVAIFDKQRALETVRALLSDTRADSDLLDVAYRKAKLEPQPIPPTLAEKFGIKN